eukprot:599502-Prymnesium_polylepis.2
MQSSGDNVAYWTELAMPSERTQGEMLSTASDFDAQYVMQDQLGAGGFGSVHVAVRRDDDEDRVAVKRLALGRMHEDDIKREVAVLMALDHPHGKSARVRASATAHRNDGAPHLSARDPLAAARRRGQN